jgi:hypothetical protein
MDFYDDNFGLITALMEAYYRYYYADANTAGEQPGSYGTGSGDTLYKDTRFNSFRFGLDNNVPVVPFFDKIEITQLQRRRFTTFRLIRPILSAWNHDSVDYSDTSTPMQNSITVNYDTVVYERGDVETGSNGSPTTFGQEKYDKVPSPLSTLGGTAGGLSSVFGGVGDIVGGRTGGLLGSAIAATNVVGTARNLTREGLRQEGLNIATRGLDQTTGLGLSGILGAGSSGSNLQIVFPGNFGTTPDTFAETRLSDDGSVNAGTQAASAPRTPENLSDEQLASRLASEERVLREFEARVEGNTAYLEQNGPDSLTLPSGVDLAEQNKRIAADSQQRLAELQSEQQRRQTTRAPASSFDQTNPRGF